MLDVRITGWRWLTLPSMIYTFLVLQRTHRQTTLTSSHAQGASFEYSDTSSHTRKYGKFELLDHKTRLSIVDELTVCRQVSVTQARHVVGLRTIFSAMSPFGQAPQEENISYTLKRITLQLSYSTLIDWLCTPQSNLGRRHIAKIIYSVLSFGRELRGRLETHLWCWHTENNVPVHSPIKTNMHVESGSTHAKSDRDTAMPLESNSASERIRKDSRALFSARAQIVKESSVIGTSIYRTY